MNYKKIIGFIFLSGVLGMFVHIAIAQTTGTTSTITNTATADTLPPSAPVLASPLVSTSSISISWASSTDNVGVYGYGVYRNDVSIGFTKTLSYTDSNGLYPGISYTYSVTAYDTSSNTSPRSTAVTAVIPVTQTTPLEVPPPVISLIRVENVFETKAQIRWVTDKPADSRVFYYVSTGATSGALLSYDTACQIEVVTTDHCVNLTGLLPSTLYYYKAESRYTTGSTVSSAVSDIRQFSTLAPTTVIDTQLSSTTTTTSVNSAPVSSTGTSTTTTSITTSYESTSTPNVVSNPPLIDTGVITPVSATSTFQDKIFRPTELIPPTVLKSAPSPHTTQSIPETNITKVAQKEIVSIKDRKPLISILGGGNKISGKTEVYINTPKSTQSIEVSLVKQGLEENPLYLGQATPDLDNGRFVLPWDSSQTPDGVYRFLVIANMNDGRIVRGIGMSIVIANEVKRMADSNLVKTVRSTNEVTSMEASTTSTSLNPGAELHPRLVVERVIDQIRKEQETKEQQIKNELLLSLNRVVPDIDMKDLEKALSVKSEEIRRVVFSDDIDKKNEIIDIIVESGGVVDQNKRDLLAKEVESGFLKLEEMANEQKNGVVDEKNFSVNEIKVAEVSKKIDGTETAKKIEFKGKALPNSFATLYIFSMPIVVTVKTDNDGYWNYTLDKELEDGKHQVYVGITDVKGNVVAKSKPLPFIKVAQAVSAVEEEEIALAVETQEAPSFVGSGYFYALLVAVSLVIIGLIVLIGIRRGKTSI